MSHQEKWLQTSALYMNNLCQLMSHCHNKHPQIKQYPTETGHMQTSIVQCYWQKQWCRMHCSTELCISVDISPSSWCHVQLQM